MTAAQKKAAAEKEKKKEDAALKRTRDERNAGLRDFGGKGGLSNLNDPKDPKRLPVAKAIVLPGEGPDLTSAALPKSRIPPAPAPQGQQASGGNEDMNSSEDEKEETQRRLPPPKDPPGTSVKVFLVVEPDPGRGPQCDSGAQFVTVIVPSDCTEDDLKILVIDAVYAAHRRLGFPALAR